MIKEYTGSIKFSVNQKIDDEFQLKKTINNFIKSLIGSRFFSGNIVIQILDVKIKKLVKEEPELLMENK